MQDKKYQIHKIMPEMREMFCEIFNLQQIPIQILTDESERPLVIHHQTKQITYVLKGQGKIYLDADIHYISEGNLILIDQNTPHSFAGYDEELQLVHWHWPENQVDTDRNVLKMACTELFRTMA